jgi:hypothetical protein
MKKQNPASLAYEHYSVQSAGCQQPVERMKGCMASSGSGAIQVVLCLGPDSKRAAASSSGSSLACRGLLQNKMPQGRFCSALSFPKHMFVVATTHPCSAFGCLAGWVAAVPSATLTRRIRASFASCCAEHC